MVIMQCVTVMLLCLLLIKSINQDNRMARLEKFVGIVLASVRERESMMSDQMFSGETIENVDDMEEVTDDGEGEDR